MFLKYIDTNKYTYYNIYCKEEVMFMKKYLFDYKEVIIFYLTIILGFVGLYFRFKYLNA